ncbi:Tol-Pal system subunit TolQ [Bryobacterales bacterium F-183]|nr:Tol-Pal system subunit TolQ [Bryobacterales bacterium F-183]
MTIIPFVALLQVTVSDLVRNAKPIPAAVMITLLLLSIFSLTIIFSKWKELRAGRDANRLFLKHFRQTQTLENAVKASEQNRTAPLVSVFAFGYNELERQVRQRGSLINRAALERSLQLGISEEMARLERNMNWLATIATITPFIGLFGTVWGIIDAFNALGAAGSASLRAVAPGIADALIATALGLTAAIPAAIFYNYFGHVLKELGTRMEDFSLEFLNLTESTYGG